MSEEWPISEKNMVYHERNMLVALLARLYPSGIRRTDIEGWDPAWHGCVYIDLPTGQVSWHYHENEQVLFADLPPYEKPYDGHSTAEKYRRVTAYWLSALAIQQSIEKYIGPIDGDKTDG